MIYCFDIDNTLCRTKGTDYKHAQPIRERIELVNMLKRDGHRIIIYTGRGSKSGKDWIDFTERQLLEWGLEYDELLFGKPVFDVFVDDLAVNADEFFTRRF